MVQSGNRFGADDKHGSALVDTSTSFMGFVSAAQNEVMDEYRHSINENVLCSCCEIIQISVFKSSYLVLYYVV